MSTSKVRITLQQEPREAGKSTHRYGTQNCTVVISLSGQQVHMKCKRDNTDSQTMCYEKRQIKSEKASKSPSFLNSLQHICIQSIAQNNHKPVNITVLSFLLQLPNFANSTDPPTNNTNNTHKLLLQNTTCIGCMGQKALYFFSTIKIRREWSSFCVLGVVGVS